jgi:hypothetical protein
MKDKKKVITITYSILSFLWGISVAGVAVALFSIFFIYTNHPSIHSLVSIPVTLELKQGLVQTTSDTNFMPYERITLNKKTYGSVTLNTPSIYQKSLVALGLLLTFLGVFICVHLLRRVIKSIYDGNEFNRKNISDLKLLAYLVMWLPFLYSILKSLLQFSAIKELKFILLAKEEAFKFMNGVSIDYNFFLFIVLGGIIYILAAVFETGYQLKQENDLTV